MKMMTLRAKSTMAQRLTQSTMPMAAKAKATQTAMAITMAQQT